MISVDLPATSGADNGLFPPLTSPGKAPIRTKRSDNNVLLEDSSTGRSGMVGVPGAISPSNLFINWSAKSKASSSASEPRPGPRSNRSGSASGGTPRKISIKFGDGGPHTIELQHQQQQSSGEYLDVDPKATRASFPYNIGGSSSAGESSTGTPLLTATSDSSQVPLLESQLPDFQHFSFPNTEAGPSTAETSFPAGTEAMVVPRSSSSCSYCRK
jgi:hypothetical protein